MDKKMHEFIPNARASNSATPCPIINSTRSKPCSECTASVMVCSTCRRALSSRKKYAPVWLSTMNSQVPVTTYNISLLIVLEEGE